jgi:hypothetical protein
MFHSQTLRCSVRFQLILVVMRSVNTEPLYRSVQVTLGHCLLLEGQNFLGSLISQPDKYPFMRCDSPPPPPSPSYCCLIWARSYQAIHLFSSSLLIGLDNQSLSLFHAAWLLFLCNEKKHGNDEDMNAGSS